MTGPDVKADLPWFMPHVPTLHGLRGVQSQVDK